MTSLRSRTIQASLATVLLLLFGHPALAANRCTDSKGKVTYQDAPCASISSGSTVETSEAFSTKPKAAATPNRVSGTATTTTGSDTGDTSAYSTYRGAWRGPSQFELSLN